MPSLKLAISSCLIGNRVRYDGRDKFSDLYQKLIKLGAELVPICPEVGIGMPVPRPPIQLVEEASVIKVKMVGDHSQDFTQQLEDYAHNNHDLLNTCDGYITAQRSPSCGFTSTNLFGKDGKLLSNAASGVFIAKIREEFPDMPICDEEHLLKLGNLKLFLQEAEKFRGNKKGL